MPNSTEYIAYIHELMGPDVVAKRMFGGHGFFRQGLMFALVVNDQLYFKADDSSAAAFCHLGLTRFSYKKQGKTCYINYYQAPESCFDDPDEMHCWSDTAFKVAREAAQ